MKIVWFTKNCPYCINSLTYHLESDSATIVCYHCAEDIFVNKEGKCTRISKQQLLDISRKTSIALGMVKMFHGSRHILYSTISLN